MTMLAYSRPAGGAEGGRQPSVAAPSARALEVKTLVRPAAAGALLGALAFGVGACGGSEQRSTSREGARGGTLTMLAPTDVDFLDPGRTYFSLGFQVALATQRPLYRYRPDELSDPLPDMAAAAPSIGRRRADDHDPPASWRALLAAGQP